MKDNKQIFNEAFFKKATYAEKQAKKFPQYAPVDMNQKVSASKIGTSTAPAFQVSDTDEVKKRLTGTFGVAFGSNNVKNMANRAVKTFPIIISDNIEPETAVMLKKLMEEQYAEYINLLISNQVVNLSDYSANDPEGNIAIQALDKISGNDFSKSRLANMAVRKDNMSMDDVFTNIPLYNLLRENQMVLSTGDCIIDTLLEGAVVVPTDEADKVVKYMLTEAEPITTGGQHPGGITDPGRVDLGAGKTNNNDNRHKNNKIRDYMKDDYLQQYGEKDYGTRYTQAQQNIAQRTDAFDMARGYHGTDDMGREIYSKLSTGDIVIDSKQFDAAINRSVGELLTDPKNAEIKKRFEAAMMLMQSRRISGVECYTYCTKRLGIPVSDNARKQMVQQFKASDIRKYGQGLSKEEGGKAGYVIGKAELNAITENRVYTEKIVKEISSSPVKALLGSAAAGAAGFGIGAGISAATTAGGAGAAASTGAIASTIATLAASPLALPILGAALGVGAFALIRSAMKRKAQNKMYANMSKTEGWERVEMLIDKMFEQQEEIRNINNWKKDFKDQESYKMINSLRKDSEEFGNSAENDAIGSLSNANNKMKAHFDPKTNTEFLQAKKEYMDQIDAAQRNIQRALTEGMSFVNSYATFNEYSRTLNEEVYATNVNNILNETCDELAKDPDFVAQFLTEKTLAATTMPMKVQYVQKKEDKDLLMTPSFMARDTYAYGSTEIERKENKDRRYNQPLIMTIKFKERFSDGKYTDNELTAVIGILGKVIRVSSDEMEYILKENTQGNTVEGIFKTGDLKNAISDMLSTSKISKDLKSLPQSGDIWHNLERIATLASANKITGKRNSNIANAHIVFSQKEIDAVRSETGVDYLRDTKKSVALMKRYSAFTLMVANDAGQRVYIMDDQDDISWNVVPYSALAGKDSGEQLNAALNKMMRL